MSLWNSLQGILTHPLNRGKLVGSLSRWLRWQVGSRLVHGARSDTDNTLYVRDAVRLVERLRTAARFRLGTGADI